MKRVGGTPVLAQAITSHCLWNDVALTEKAASEERGPRSAFMSASRPRGPLQPQFRKIQSVQEPGFKADR